MMLIRSQDREILVPFNRPIYVSGRQVIYCEEIESSNGSLLGNYASESRCLEILDEIQAEFQYVRNVTENQEVYQMPEK